MGKSPDNPPSVAAYKLSIAITNSMSTLFRWASPLYAPMSMCVFLCVFDKNLVPPPLCSFLCPSQVIGTLGYQIHRDTGTPDTGSPGHWDTGELVNWDTGTPGHWDTGAWGQ